jgi:hypothetical protein
MSQAAKNKTFEAFKEIIENAYDYEEALKRLNIKQKDVDLVREKVKFSKEVPRFLHDKQVKTFKKNINSRVLLYLNKIFSRFCIS